MSASSQSASSQLKTLKCSSSVWLVVAHFLVTLPLSFSRLKQDTVMPPVDPSMWPVSTVGLGVVGTAFLLSFLNQTTKSHGKNTFVELSSLLLAGVTGGLAIW